MGTSSTDAANGAANDEDSGGLSCATGLRCVICETRFLHQQLYNCPACGGILEVEYDYLRAGEPDAGRWQNLLLPIEPTRRVTLGEGRTALVAAPKLAEQLGATQLLLKCEFTNPTGSFKDRPISVGITKAIEFGRDTVIVASTGNAAASVAAYAARAGIRAVVLVPEDTSPEKVSQTLFYGAVVVRTCGTFSDCYAVALELAQRYGFVNMSTTFLNPYTVEGNKEIAFEIHCACDDAGALSAPVHALGGREPDEIFVPVGAGPMLVGIANGYRDLLRIGRCRSAPAMVAVQAEGCRPIAVAWESGAAEVREVPRPQTVARGIGDGLCGYAADGTHTLRAVRASRGYAVTVSDARILEAQRLLAESEGLFVEPTGAAGLAGAMNAAADGGLQGKTIVVILSGHGLKDRVELGAEPPLVDATAEAVLSAL